MTRGEAIRQTVTSALVKAAPVFAAAGLSTAVSLLLVHGFPDELTDGLKDALQPVDVFALVFAVVVAIAWAACCAVCCAGWKIGGKP